MEADHSHIEKIEKFLRDQLTSGEKEAFENEIDSDENLKEAVSDLSKVLKGMENSSIREEIRSIHERKSQMPNTKSRRVELNWFYRVAAAFLLLAVVWYFTSLSESNQELYANYFSPYPDAISLRGEGTEEISKAMKLYAGGSYSEAAVLLSAVEKESLYFEDTRFYLAICLLASDETSESITILAQLEKQQQSRFLPQIRWYLALAYLKNDELRKSIESLNTIGGNEFKYREAQQLIKLLRKH